MSELYILDNSPCKVNVLFINMSQMKKCLLVVSSQSQAAWLEIKLREEKNFKFA